MSRSSSASSDSALAVEAAQALTDDLAYDFAQSAIRVFRAAYSRAAARDQGDRNLSLDAENVARLVAAMRNGLQTALASELRSHNANMATGSGMPDELWCEIWDHLSMDDCISVSQVCGAWRALALRTPRLWTRLDFVSTHHDDLCDCDSCTSGEYDLTCPRCRTPYGGGHSNVATITRILPRSARSALTLHLDIKGPYPDHDPLKMLASAISPHCDRLVAVHIIAEHEYPMSACFVSLPTSLPILRAIICKRSPSDRTGMYSVELVDRQVSWPALRSIEFHSHLTFYGYLTGDLHLPSVRTVSTTFLEAAQLQTYVKACPDLATLCVRMTDADATPSWYDSIRSQTRRIGVLRICELTHENEDRALTMFHHSGSRGLALHYANKFAVGAGTRGLQILADLRDDVDFSFTLDSDTQMKIVAVDRHGCKRELKFRLFTASVFPCDIWNHLLPAAVRSLTLLSHLWLHFKLLPPLPSMKKLTLILTEPQSLPNLIAASRAPHVAVLPRLEVLHLVGPSASSPTTVATTELAFFVSRLRGEGRLRTTVLTHVVPAGEPCSVLGVVETCER